MSRLREDCLVDYDERLVRLVASPLLSSLTHVRKRFDVSAPKMRQCEASRQVVLYNATYLKREACQEKSTSVANIISLCHRHIAAIMILPEARELGGKVKG